MANKRAAAGAAAAATGSGGDHREVVAVGGARAVCVEFPGAVASTDRAIAALGGAAAIKKACQSQSGGLELRLGSPGDGSLPSSGNPPLASGVEIEDRVRITAASELIPISNPNLERFYSCKVPLFKKKIKRARTLGGVM